MAQADPNGDVIYYEACNPTTGCFDGVIRTPVADKPGWVGSYEYRLVPDAAPYQVSLQSCVRVDRVLDGTTGLVVRPTRFRDVELHCGPLYVGKNGGNLVYQQQPFPDSVLADKLHAMDAQDAVVDSKLEALFTAAQTYAKQNSLDSNQLAGIAATIGQERDNIYPLAKSSLTDQILQVAQSNVEHAGLSLAGATGPHCVTNQQVAQAVQAATGTLTPLPPQSEGANAAAAAAPKAQQQQDIAAAVLATQQVIASVGGDPSPPPPVVASPPVVTPSPVTPTTPDTSAVPVTPTTSDTSAEGGTTTTTTTNHDGGGLSKGAIAGAVIGSVVGALVVVAAIGVVVRRQSGKSPARRAVVAFENPLYGNNPSSRTLGDFHSLYGPVSSNLHYEAPSTTSKVSATYGYGEPSVYRPVEAAHRVDQTKVKNLSLRSNGYIEVEGENPAYVKVEGTAEGTIAKFGRVHLLAASPEQTFLAQLETLTNDFLSARQAYLALVADLGAYLQAQ